MNKELKIVGTVSADEAIEQFANQSEKNREIVNKALKQTPLEIINKLKDKCNKYDRQVINCRDEILYLIKEDELNIIENAIEEKERLFHLQIFDNF